jgi:uncharacterized protein (DUF983 family)
MVETPRKQQVRENAATTEPRSAPAPIGAGTPQAVARRNLALAVGRGLLERCPNCGKGAMFGAYLSVNPRCPACGEDLSAQRADDAPAFVALLVVCLVGGGGVLLSEDAWPQMPLLAVAVFWLVVTALVSLAVLPRIKGAVVGYQWALRMHGFAAARTSPQRASINTRQH